LVVVISRKQFQPVISIAATLIGTVVGAGFASGQEIFQFFSRFGTAGLSGLLLAVTLLGVASNQVFKIGLQLKTNSYREFLVYLLGPRLLPGADLFFTLFLLLLVGVMFAGSGAVFAALNLDQGIGLGITGLILVGVLSRGLSGMVKVNLCIVPLMFVFCLIVAGYAFFARSATGLPLPAQGCWVLAALQFTAYNLVLAAPVLLALAQGYPDPTVLRLGCWLGSIALGVLAVLINWSILAHFTALQQSALPMVVLAKKVNGGVFWGYSLVLWGEMLTTSLANIYSLGQRLYVWSGWSFRGWAAILSVTGIVISNLGFVKLIAIFYPVYGCLSLVLLVLILAKA
jgi:uncharacterized membrane protein YkvI